MSTSSKGTVSVWLWYFGFSLEFFRSTTRRCRSFSVFSLFILVQFQFGLNLFIFSFSLVPCPSLFSFKNFSPCSSCADISVQVIFPGSQYQTNEQEQPKHVSSAVDSTNPVGLASSAAPLSVCVHYLFFGFLLLSVDSIHKSPCTFLPTAIVIVIAYQFQF